MAFGELNPSVKNLLVPSNEWFGQQTITRNLLGSSPTYGAKLRNTSPAASGAQQASPTFEMEGQGLATGGGSRSVRFDKYVLPVQGSSVAAGILKHRYSLNNAAFVDVFEIGTVTDSDIPYSRTYGRLEGNLSNSSTLGTRQNLRLDNPSGSKINTAYAFNNVIKSGVSVDSSGYTNFKSVASSGWSFEIGASIDSTSYILQIYGSGIYNSQNTYSGGVVTAGSADTSTNTKLSSYGSFALKGILVTATNYQITENESVVYGDGSNSNACVGTPTHDCSFYGDSTSCNAHSGVGCSWFSGNSCSTFNGNQGGCEGQSPCVWEQASCSGANNTDQSTCENQDDSYGGNCSWDTSTCPSQGDQTSCQAIPGCTWNSSPCSNFNGTDQGTCESHSGCTWEMLDCHTFDNTDQSTCETGHSGCSWSFQDCHQFDGDQTSCENQSGCSWDGDNNLCNGEFNRVCNGTYPSGNCNGNYDVSCSGNLCNGNYNTGNCTGTYGAQCQGSANCGNLTDDGQTACNAESGCSWQAGAIYTLPASINANKGNTSRMHWIKNVGASGTITVQAFSGDTLESSIALTPGQSVTVHHHTITGNCSTFTTSGTCTPSGCFWTPASCGDFGADEATCNAQSGNGCSWNSGNSTCEGTYSGSAGSCGGTYTVSKKWYKHASFG